MPNHVHVIARLAPNQPMAKVLQTWKGYTARQANLLLGCKGSFWQRDYFDRVIRDESHYRKAVNYIEWNAVKARLASSPEKYPYCSAWFHQREFG